MQVSRGMQSLWLRVSNRGEQHPVGTRFCAAKSSVLYLLRPRRWKGSVTVPDRPFPVAAEGRIFAGTGGLRIFVLRVYEVRQSAGWRPKLCYIAGEQKVYKARRSDAFPRKVIDHSSIISSIFFETAIHASMMDASKNVRRYSYHHGSSNHTLSRACASVLFALLSDR